MRPETEKLYDLIVNKVKATSVFADHCGGQAFDIAAAEQNIWCVLHNNVVPPAEGKSPSLSVSDSGAFYCHSGGCNAKGKNIIQFIERLRGITMVEALRYLYSLYIQLTIDTRVNEGYHVNLIHSPEILAALEHTRGLNIKTVEQFKLGWDNKRLTIPVWNEFGLLVNIRRYDLFKRHPVKMLPYDVGYGAVQLFPHSQLQSYADLILCEGETDCMLLVQHGLNAVTTTGGVGAWKNDWTPLFAGKRVTICFDVNDPRDAGQRCARRVAGALALVAQEVRILTLPLENRGGDVTDYLHNAKHTVDEFKALLTKATVISKRAAKIKVTRKADGNTVYEVPLGEASSSDFYGKRIRMTCMVAGKDLAPFLPPRRVRVMCTPQQSQDCDGCPYKGASPEAKEVDLSEHHHKVLKLIDTSELRQRQAVRTICRIPSSCQVPVQVLDAFNVENIQLIPETDFSSVGAPYVLRNAYHIGHGIQCNKVYTFEGITIPDEQQYATHVLTKAEPSQTAIENFEVTDQVYKQLEVFKSVDVDVKLREIYSHLSVNVTRIFRRADLHQAVDLVFHSPLQFMFNGETVPKGWLDALIIGDTRTGKGYVAEGLIRYYRLGEIASAENCTFAGLIGGLQQTGSSRWIVTWGKIPLNDRRLVILDEVSALSIEDIQRMSRVRSEGIAEVTKIQTERTMARTRLVWLANPRSGHPMSSYNTGVEAVHELVGRNEDIARFDYALTVASEEVPSSVMNRAFVKHMPTPYTADACRSLVLWAWSRTKDQVTFTSKATERILASAKELGRKYSSSIPLVQSENMRIKLAKVAVATAIRVFSEANNGQTVLVEQRHVESAENFLNSCYCKRSMGYDVFSRTVFEREALADEESLNTAIDRFDDKAMSFVRTMMERTVLSYEDIIDAAGVERDQARAMIGLLVRNHALLKAGLNYRKTPAFMSYLRKRRAHYELVGSPHKRFQ